MPGRFCRRVPNLFTAYLHDELNPAVQRRVEEHLTECEACQKDLQGVQQAVRHLQLLEPVPVPTGLRAAVHTRIAAQARPPLPVPSWPAWMRPALATAAVLLLGMGFAWWWNRPVPSAKVAPSPSLLLAQELPPQAGPVEPEKPARVGEKIAPTEVAAAVSPDPKTSSPRAEKAPVTPASRVATPPRTRPALPRNTSPARVKRQGKTPRANPIPSGEVAVASPKPIAPLGSMLQRAAQGGSRTALSAQRENGDAPERPRGTPRSLRVPEEAPAPGTSLSLPMVKDTEEQEEAPGEMHGERLEAEGGSSPPLRVEGSPGREEPEKAVGDDGDSPEKPFAGEGGTEREDPLEGKDG